jgi:hypothetical protein
VQQLREVYSPESGTLMFFWVVIQTRRDMVELRLRITGQVGVSREILPQQQIGVFVGAALPGTLRIAEVDLHIRGYSGGVAPAY